MKKMFGVFTAVLLLFLSYSCDQSNINREVTDGEIKTAQQALSKDAFFADLSGFNHHYYEDVGGSNGFSFRFVSGVSLSEEDVVITTDSNAPVKFSFHEVKDYGELPYYIFQALNETDWEELSQLFRTYEESGNSEANKTYRSKRDALLEAYSAEIELPPPEFYYYSGYIGLTERTDRINTTQITLTVNDVEYVYKGSIRFHGSLGLAPGSALIQQDLAISDYPVLPNSEGNVDISSLTFTMEVVEDLQITDVRFLPGTVSLNEVSFSIIHNDVPMNIKFDGSSISVKGGTELIMNVSFIDEAFQKKLNYTGNAYMFVDYRAGDEDFSTQFTVSYEVRTNPYEIIAVQRDGVDMSDYYFKYLELITTSLR